MPENDRGIKVGFIGLGTIGAAIAQHIGDAGYALVVHDIRAQAVDRLVGKGAERGISPEQVGRNCAVVFTSLPGPREVEAVALASDGLLHGIGDGSIHVDLSTSSPELIKKIAREFRSRGARVMDAPLIVGRYGVANKSLQVLASADADTFTAVKPILVSFADQVVYAGELGTGTVIKLAHNLVRRGIGLAIGEGLVLGAKAGVPPQLLWECMHWGLEVQLQQLLKTFSETVFKGNFEGPASFGIGLSRKDVGLASELGRQYQVPMPIAALVEQTMIQAINRGWSEQSTASLFRLQEEAAGIEVREKRD
ncbi:MAG: NAD(P)-dependent oxidoreductase [Chloroflexota bacterium]